MHGDDGNVIRRIGADSRVDPNPVGVWGLTPESVLGLLAPNGPSSKRILVGSLKLDMANLFRLNTSLSLIRLELHNLP